MKNFKESYRWFMKVTFFNKFPEIFYLGLLCAISGILYYHGPSSLELVFGYTYDFSFWAMFISGAIRIIIVWYNFITNKDGQRK